MQMTKKEVSKPESPPIEKPIVIDEPGALEDEDVAPLDDVVDLLNDLDDTLLVEEPDQSVLALEAEDLENLVKEEPLDLLDNPSLMMELSEDPVRLYLKEIGGIELLDTDREFWLATRLEAAAASTC